MTEGIAKGRPGVVVFAIDFLPPSVASQPSDTVLFRRFMDGSGRVVWPGYPPMAVMWDPESGDPVAVDMTRPSLLLAVDHVGAMFDEYPAFASSAGLAFGMPRQWIGRGGVDPSEVRRVLALEERGRAVAWIRTYGRAPGSGFVRYWARRDPMPHLGVVLRLAEGTLVERRTP